MFAPLLAFAFLAQSAPAPSPPELRRALVLGDSITADGRYVEALQGYFATRFPDRDVTFIPLGLPSETVTGLTEPGHPFPRTDVHERLGRALDKIKPDLVIACYGMNDGIYAPFSRERFGLYQDAILRLVARCREAKARVYLVTPPPFDAVPVRDKTRPLGADEYGWLHPFADYDAVLARYASWLLTLDGVNFATIDAHGPLSAQLQSRRAADPEFRFAGDGVHLDGNGQQAIAVAILRAWHEPDTADELALDAKSLTVQRGSNVADLRSESGGVRFSWPTRIPMPVVDGATRDDAFGRHVLAITNLDRDRFAIYEGPRLVGRASRADLASGIDLRTFPELSTNRRSAEVATLLRERSALLRPAWLDAVGHTRPDMPKGQPLVRATAATARMEAEIKRLATPATVELRVVAE